MQSAWAPSSKSHKPWVAAACSWAMRCCKVQFCGYLHQQVLQWGWPTKTVICQCSQEQTLSLCPKEMEQRDPKPPHQEGIWASLFCSLLSNPSDFVFSELISISHHKSPSHVPRKIMPAVCGEFLMHFTISLTITALFRMERIILLCSFRMINCRILKDSSLNANNR